MILGRLIKNRNWEYLNCYFNLRRYSKLRDEKKKEREIFRVVDVCPAEARKREEIGEREEIERDSNYRGKGWTKLMDGIERERERGGSPNLDRPVAGGVRQVSESTGVIWMHGTCRRPVRNNMSESAKQRHFKQSWRISFAAGT